MVCAGIRAPNQAEASSGCFEDASLATDNPTDRTACYAKKDQNAKPSQSDYRIHLPMTRRIPFAVDCAGEQNHQLGNSTPKARANRRPWCASGHGCPTSQGPNALTSSLHSSCRSQVRLWCSPAMGECVVCPLDFGIHGQGSEPSTKLRSSCILAAFR